MSRNQRRRLTTAISSVLVASLALGAVGSMAIAAPDKEGKAEQKALREAQREERKALREEQRSERAELREEWKAQRAELREEWKAQRATEREERKAELEALKVERADLREARKAALEVRKAEARALRDVARAEIAGLREGFAEMTPEERRATLDQIREVRGTYREALHELQEAWRTERDALLPNTLRAGAEEGLEGEPEPEEALEEEPERAEALEEEPGEEPEVDE